MREILFRGQTRKHGEKVRMGSGEPLPGNWVYGGIFHQNDRGGSFSIIYTYDPIEKRAVYADTVGQYTGLSDINGTKIFEGDIVQDKQVGLFGKVVYVTSADGYDGVAGFMVDDIDDGLQNYSGFWHLCEVIGNIYDNPELWCKNGVNINEQIY